MIVHDIVKMYEAGLSPAEISLELSIDETAVKTALAQYAPTYKSPETPGPQLEFTSEQQSKIQDAIYKLAMYSEDDTVRGRMLLYLYEEIKGRNEAKARRDNSSITFNVLQFNQALKKLRHESKVVDCESPCP